MPLQLATHPSTNLIPFLGFHGEAKDQRGLWAVWDYTAPGTFTTPNRTSTGTVLGSSLLVSQQPLLQSLLTTWPPGFLLPAALKTQPCLPHSRQKPGLKSRPGSSALDSRERAQLPLLKPDLQRKTEPPSLGPDSWCLSLLHLSQHPVLKSNAQTPSLPLSSLSMLSPTVACSVVFGPLCPTSMSALQKQWPHLCSHCSAPQSRTQYASLVLVKEQEVAPGRPWLELQSQGYLRGEAMAWESWVHRVTEPCCKEFWALGTLWLLLSRSPK